MVGTTYDQDSDFIRVRAARQFVQERYGVVARMLQVAQERICPDFMVIESNQRTGKRVVQLFREKYGLDVKPVYTTANMVSLRPHAMDKPATVKFLKTRLKEKTIKFNLRAAHMHILIDQINSIVSGRTPAGNVTYKGMRGRHDDLFSALLLNCHIIRCVMAHSMVHAR